MKNYFEALVRSNFRCGRMLGSRTVVCAGDFAVPFSMERD